MNSKKKSILLISAIVVFGVVARLLPHFPNFAPMGALALFAVAFYNRKYLALIVPALAWWLSDLYLNNTQFASAEGFSLFTYDQLFAVLALVGIVGLGSLILKKISVSRVLLGSVSASLIFFLVSNFGVWIQGLLYPKTILGLIECYAMALPFYRATFLSDLIFTSVFFGAMYFYSQHNDSVAQRFELAN